MRTFSEIVDDYGRARLSEMIGVPRPTINSWVRRDSIPWWYWQDIRQAGAATIAELFEASRDEWPD
jgi:hypothetical protein